MKDGIGRDGRLAEPQQVDIRFGPLGVSDDAEPVNESASSRVGGAGFSGSDPGRLAVSGRAAGAVLGEGVARGTVVALGPAQPLGVARQQPAQQSLDRRSTLGRGAF